MYFGYNHQNSLAWVPGWFTLDWDWDPLLSLCSLACLALAESQSRFRIPLEIRTLGILITDNGF